MESWSYGFKPNWIAELRAWYSWSDAPPIASCCGIARREFGAGSEELVLKAWEQFSGRSAGFRIRAPPWAPTVQLRSLLFRETQTGAYANARTFMAGSGPLDGGTGINPYWPYVLPLVSALAGLQRYKQTWRRDYARPFSLAVFNKYLLLAADEMQKGLESYRRAALQRQQRSSTEHSAKCSWPSKSNE